MSSNVNAPTEFLCFARDALGVSDDREAVEDDQNARQVHCIADKAEETIQHGTIGVRLIGKGFESCLKAFDG